MFEKYVYCLVSFEDGSSDYFIDVSCNVSPGEDVRVPDGISGTKIGTVEEVREYNYLTAPKSPTFTRRIMGIINDTSGEEKISSRYEWHSSPVLSSKRKEEKKRKKNEKAAKKKAAGRKIEDWLIENELFDDDNNE